jgi:hypothetical protein
MQTAINEEVPEIIVVLNYLLEVGSNNKLSPSNKFSFDSNDYKKTYKSPIKLMSHHLWKQDEGIVISSDIFSFYVVKNANTFAAYVHDSKNSTSNIDSLIKKVNQNPELVESDLVLRIENEKPLYLNKNFMVAFSNDLKLFKTALIDKGFGEPKYPIDIKSYEYQLSYWQKKTRIPEFDFINNVLLGGFMSEYDSEKGRFYIKNTKYDPTVVGFRIKEKDQKSKVSLVDRTKIDFEYLDDDWYKALGKVLTILKRDRPQYGEKEENLDKLINFYEKKLKNKSAQTCLDFNKKP